MTLKRVKIHYSGSLFWLVFWLIVFFPVAFVLIATGGRFELDENIYSIKYDGSRNWLCFWAVVFFPIVLILVLINGFSVEVQTKTEAPHNENTI